ASGVPDEFRELLDHELDQLPRKYQEVLVLCDLEGLGRSEAARQLGCPEGTVASRLARARALLARRLQRRGLALSGATLAAALAPSAESAGVPPALTAATVKSASLVAMSGKIAAGIIPANVLSLTKGVQKAMLLTKVKTVTFVLVSTVAFSTCIAAG